MADDLTPTSPQMPVGGGRCATCGHDVPAAARFCPNCGTPFDPADASDAEATTVMAPLTTAEPVVEDAPVVAAGPRDRPWPWALTLGVPLAIILLILILLVVRSVSDNGSSTDTTTTTEAPASTVTTEKSVTTQRPPETRPPATSPPETSPPATSPPQTSPPATTPDTVSVP